MKNIPSISSEVLIEMLSSKKSVNILDIRPLDERKEWFIPGSIHIDAYSKLKQNDSSVFDDLQLDPAVPVVTVCAGGKTSLIAAEMLQQKGYNAYSLQEGMKGWSLAWNSAIIEFPGSRVIQLRRTGKGCLSYVVISGKEAIAIDASLPIEVYENILINEHVILKAVLETHIHADHLSRSKLLAEKFKTKLYMPHPNKVLFDHLPLKPGQDFYFGKISLQIIPTPGHTMESISLLVNKDVLFTGDTLFTNGIGRPDLKAEFEEAKLRAGLLYDSLQLLMNMNEDILVLPAHSNIPANFDNKPVMATIKELKKTVHLINLPKSEFIETILSKLPAPPANFQTIVEKNLKGDFSDINPVELEAGANRCAVS